jgi:SAM-dependent methyltransferase
MSERQRNLYKRDFWAKENLNYSKPHFRLEKSARLINKMSAGRPCDVLDVGCGPATLMPLLQDNVRYYGVDIAIHDPAPNLIQADLLESPICFREMRFDIVLAQGFFEYVGDYQDEKLAEISRLLQDDGKFIVTYVNFAHRNRQIYWPYSNMQSIEDFRKSLARHFSIDRFFPVSHNWRHSNPGRAMLRFSQMHLNVNVPVFTPMLAVEYFFVCSAA